MLLVTRKDHESPEALLRRFNKMVQRDGVLQESRRRAASSPTARSSAKPNAAPPAAAAEPKSKPGAGSPFS